MQGHALLWASTVCALVGCAASGEPAPATSSKPSVEPAPVEAGPVARSDAPSAPITALDAGWDAAASESTGEPPVVQPSIADDDGGSDNGGEVLAGPPHPATGNDLTYACRTDADCNFGDCYVPGRDINPICSKRCDTDVDCPQGARCAQPLACSDDEAVCEGSGYCFRACSSDDECLAFNPLGTRPGENTLDANSVECVAWNPIGVFGWPNPPTPPIDICIQRSEP
jgi:hypothetical protein